MSGMRIEYGGDEACNEVDRRYRAVYILCEIVIINYS